MSKDQAAWQEALGKQLIDIHAHLAALDLLGIALVNTQPDPQKFHASVEAIRAQLDARASQADMIPVIERLYSLAGMPTTVVGSDD